MTIHYINFSVPINTVTASRFRHAALSAVGQGATSIEVHFNSPGGFNVDGFGLYGFIRSLPIPIQMHNIGTVESMGVLIYLASNARSVSPFARFVLHATHWNFGPGDFHLPKLREIADSLEDDGRRYAQLFGERTQGSERPLNIKALMRSGHRVISASEAVRMGIAHRVSDAAIPPGICMWNVEP